MKKMLDKILSKFVDRYDYKPKTKNPQILDIGCGTSPSKEANVILDKDNSIRFDGKKFICHDLNKIPYPFKNSTFDYIYANNILEHLTVEDGMLFRELLRILKIYGKLEIHVPNSYFIYHRLVFLFGILPPDALYYHRKHYSFQQMKLNLVNSGFKVFEMYNKWVFNPFRNFTNAHIIVIGKKVDG